MKQNQFAGRKSISEVDLLAKPFTDTVFHVRQVTFLIIQLLPYCHFKLFRRLSASFLYYIWKMYVSPEYSFIIANRLTSRLCIRIISEMDVLGLSVTLYVIRRQFQQQIMHLNR